MRAFLEEMIAIKLGETETIHRDKLKSSELYFIMLIKSLGCKSIFPNTKQVAPLRGGHNLSSMYKAIKSIMSSGKVELVRPGIRFVSGAVATYHVNYYGDISIEKYVHTKNEIKYKLISVKSYENLLKLEFKG